jgi:very-short-patch-repair endonuclease
MRGEMNGPEAILWNVLRCRLLGGYRFRRQFPVGDYIVDFICLEVGLVVEVDGESHDEQIEYDRRRSRWLWEAKGLTVIRVANGDVYANLDGVQEHILAELERLRCKPP